MGKKNEIVQWVLIGVLTAYAVIVTVLFFVYVPKIVVGFLFNNFSERFGESSRICEVKEDCVYGISEFDMRAIGESFLGVDLDEKSVFYEGCVNSKRKTGEGVREFSEECICISGQCGYISD